MNIYIRNVWTAYFNKYQINKYLYMNMDGGVIKDLRKVTVFSILTPSFNVSATHVDTISHVKLTFTQALLIGG